MGLDATLIALHRVFYGSGLAPASPVPLPSLRSAGPAHGRQ